MIQNLKQIVQDLYNTPSDINEHIPTLISYGDKVNHITEFGVRGICSTWAFLASKPNTLISYDLEDPSKWGGNIKDVYDTAAHYEINFKFIKDNVLNVDIENTDLLFIDTWHVYDQVIQELNLHSHKVNKYLIFHDTTTFAVNGESPGYKGLKYGIDEFLSNNINWKFHEEFPYNNGLTILKRVNHE